MDTHEELRDELIALLGATRELSPDTDEHLADAYLQQVERRLAAPSRVRMQRTRRKLDPATRLRRGLVRLLIFVLTAPPAVFLIRFPSDGVLRHFDAAAAPPGYYPLVLLILMSILVTVWFEHHSIDVRVNRRKRLDIAP